MKRSSIALLILLTLGCRTSDPQSSEVARWTAQAERVNILRDQFGVAHVYGVSDADAVFGMLYAQCEDDFKRVERNYIWAMGRLAEVEGEEALYSDLRAQLFMTTEEAKAYYEGSPPWLKALCVAFADGINYYLHTHPEVKPALLTRFEPWMPMCFSEGSIGGDIEAVSLKKIKAFYGAGRAAAVPAVPAPAPVVPEPQGSNGFAISGSLTASGHAMLLINPHTSFYFRPEIHVVSEEGLNAYGAVTWGQFFIYQGFNEHNGWMHTSSKADVIDEFVEQIDTSGGALHYRYGSERRPVERLAVTLRYKDSSGVAQRPFELYRTHHGPITAATDEGWVATALMWSPAKALEQAFVRTKTRNYQEFRAMMDYRTNSSNNTVYADADGTVAYFHGNFMPVRDVAFDYDQPVDGSNPATDWQGLHEVDDLIQLRNPPNGWIQNCNSTPFTAALEHSPKAADYPYYMATEPESFRGVHAIQVLTGRSGYTLDTLIRVAYDPYLPAFERLVPGLVAAYERSGRAYPALAGPVAALKAWDLRVSVHSVGMTLAHYYGTHYADKGPKPPGLSFMERINYYGTDTPDGERLAMLRDAVAQLEADFGRWDIPWGEVSRFQRPSGDIELAFDDNAPSLPVGMASGNWGALASYGSRGTTGVKKIYGTYGNSFVAVVEFGERVRAKSLLAGGQSSDPRSPHFYDQAQMYADGAFKEVLFYREDVEAKAVKRYRPGQ